MKLTRVSNRRRAVSGIVAALFLFTMLFTVGTGYYLFTAAADQTNNSANISREASIQAAAEEQLTVLAPGSLATNGPTSGDLWFRVLNAGGLPTTITEVYVSNSQGQLLSKSTVGNNSPFLTGSPDINVSLPFTLNVGGSTQYSASCGSTGCDIAIAKTAYTYTSGTVYLEVVTQNGNIFSAQYPPKPLTTTTTVSTISSTTTTTSTTTVGAGGNTLVVTMSATPTQVFGGNTVTDTVTVYNYATTAVTNVALLPSMPTATVTGTASLTPVSCSPASYASITAYSGSGAAPSVVFTCTYTSETGAVGGFGSFSGAAQGTQNGVSVLSAQATSNTIQIGGTTNVTTQGAFSASFFFFGYSSCTNAPSSSHGSYTYSSACTTNPSSMPPASLDNLGDAASISGGSNYYVAYYLTVTNNFNTTLPILDYSYIQLEQSNGGETDFYIVGTATNPQTTYYPNYAVSGGVPTLTAYTSTQTTCAESAPNYNPPSPTTCIDVAPGQSVTLTFAACGYGSSNWNWGGSSRAGSWDNSSGCTSTPPAFGSSGSATAVVLVLSFLYNGQSFTQDISFQGEAILP